MRLASYTQESTRYCNYTTNKFNSQLTFIIPEWIPNRTKQYLLDGHARDSLNTNDILEDKAAFIIWWSAMHQAEINYFNLIEHGWKAQQARAILPNSLKTELVMTANLREWRHFFKMRTDKAAHPQMRELAIPMLKEFNNKIPIIFEDLNNQ